MTGVTVAAAVLLGTAVVVWPGGRGEAGERGLRRLRRAGANRPVHRRPRSSSTSRSRPRSASAPPAPLVMELVAAALDAGLPPPVALESAARAVGGSVSAELQPVVRLWRLGASVERAWREAPERWSPLARCLVLSDRTGSSAATVLRAAAGDVRSRRRGTARVGAQRLGVRLVVPLGLTTLPAFLLWAVVPVVLGVARQLVAFE